MGIFKLLFSLFKTRPPVQKTLDKDFEQIEIKDERKAECPNCNKTLSKIPGAKTKCPHCGEFMFVRTRPNHIRLVVTREGADKIDEEWSIVNKTHDIFVAEKEEYAKEKERLREKFGGKEPSHNDITQGLLNRQFAVYSVNGDWGLYRNARHSLAEILRQEQRLEASLQTYFEVCYLDLNEPNNMGGMKNFLIDNPELSKKYPPFNPNFNSLSSSLAPGILDFIRRIMLKLNLNKDRIRRIFIEHNTLVEKSLKLPLSAEKAWPVLEKELY